MSSPTHLPIPAPRGSGADTEPEAARVETPTAAPSGPRAPSVRVLSLLVQARTQVHDAGELLTPGERYAAAYVAAVRAATAIVTVRIGPRDKRPPTSVWKLLTSGAPELQEWCEFFAAGSARRAAAEAGAPVSPADAEVLVRRAREFVDIAGRSVLATLR